MGIGTNAPVAKLNIQGTSGGAPPTSGGEGTSNGIFRLRDNFNVTLDIGTRGASPWTTWLQVADSGSMGAEYPLSLNPNGGNVGIGTLTPGTKLDVNGTLKASLLTMNGTNMSKAPRVIHIDDNVPGCPPTRPVGDIMSYNLVVTRDAYVYVSVTTILNYGARSDCEIYFGSNHIQSHLTAADNTGWNPVNITAGGGVSAGTTLIRFRSNRANVVGCQGNWGGMQIIVFER